MHYECISPHRFGAGNDSRPVAISGLRCNKRTQLHTLRCNYDDLGTSSSACSHDQDVAVFCSESLCNIII